MEGTSDHHEPSTFTSRRSRWSWRLPHTSNAHAPPTGAGEKRASEGSSHAGGRGRGDRGVRGTVGRGLRGKKTPTLPPSPGRSKPGRREASEMQLRGARRVLSTHQSGSGVVKTLGPPVKPHRAQTRWGAHAGKLAVVNAGSTRGDGYTQFVRVAEVDRTHCASCLLGGRKSSWHDRALARRKLEAPPDAGHGWREGEPVREAKQTIKSTPGFGLWVSARRFSRRRKALLGFCPAGFHRHVEAESLRLASQTDGHAIREERVTGSASVATEGGRACWRVTKRVSEIDTVR